ncbi:MAG: Mur ligase family protein, partial [Actinomycetales bacterium]
TNGKTTVAAMIAAGLAEEGVLAATIGTVGVTIAGRVHPVSRTTPEAPHLQAILAALRRERAQVVALEVSSHALCEHRVDGLVFEVAVFTNLSQDHLDYHRTMDAYFQAKSSLFAPDRARFAVVCVDDDWGRRLVGQLPVPHWTYSVSGQPADWRLVGGTGDWWVEGPQGERQPLSVSLPGHFNLANAVCAYATLRRLGVSGSVAAAGIARARVPGRMEPIGHGPIRGLVDYAHSPDAIERAITGLREHGPGRILVVIGAGGDRDAGKRSLMGAAAARLADVVVITDDNPRSEDPASIRAAVLEGAASVTNGASGVAEILEVPGRAAAIEAAVNLARSGDLVLVLGKGHEQGQEIAGVVHPFDDR